MDRINRSFDLTLEKRNSDASDDTLTVTGHAAVFNQRTLIGSREYGFVEQIAPGAFADVLAQADVRYLENHGGVPFARTTNGTLRLRETEHGLEVEADLNPGMQVARDHFAAIERGDIDQMSFAFAIDNDAVTNLPSDDPEFPGMALRTVTSVAELVDVSGVTYPAYAGADISARDAEIRSVLGDNTDVIAQIVDGDTISNEERSEEDALDTNPDDELLARMAERSERRLSRKDTR